MMMMMMMKKKENQSNKSPVLELFDKSDSLDSSKLFDNEVQNGESGF